MRERKLSPRIPLEMQVKRNAGQKRTEQVIQWFNGMRITIKELVHTDAIIEDQLTVNLLGELMLHQESWILYYLPSMTILE